MQGAKSANNELFKDFCNAAKKEKNKPNGGHYLIIVPYTIALLSVLINIHMLKPYFIIFLASILIAVICYLYDFDLDTSSISHIIIIGSLITLASFFALSLIYFTITRPSMKFVKKSFKKKRR